MLSENAFQKMMSSFAAIGYYQHSDVSDGVVKIYLCKNTKRVLKDIEKRYLVCPVCGRGIDISDDTRRNNELDPLVRPWIDLGIERKGEPRFIRGIRNENLLFEYECGHKLLIYPVVGGDPLPDNAQETMFEKAVASET